MAELFHYKCSQCDFDIMSTLWGGDIYGWGHGYYLYKCEDCKWLTKVEHGFTEMARNDIGRKQKIEDQFLSSDIFMANENCVHMNKCSHCGSSKLSRWKPEYGICPKCNSKLLKLNDCIMHTD